MVLYDPVWEILFLCLLHVYPSDVVFGWLRFNQPCLSVRNPEKPAPFETALWSAFAQINIHLNYTSEVYSQKSVYVWHTSVQYFNWIPYSDNIFIIKI